MGGGRGGGNLGVEGPVEAPPSKKATFELGTKGWVGVHQGEKGQCRVSVHSFNLLANPY